MKKCLILLLAALLFGACDEEDTPVTPEEYADRTVLVYIAAENNLTGYSQMRFADDDLREMKEGSKMLDDRQNLLVYVDKAENDPPYIARIRNGELVDSFALEECLSADPAVLEEMLLYSRMNYPARSYGLVLWGHSNGWVVLSDSVSYAGTRAYGGDTGNNMSDSAGKYWMNIPSMARAIGHAMGDDHLSFILADCCNFGCIESAYELRHVTDYLITSPAEIPELGAPYHLIVPLMFDTSETFYQSVVDAYFDYYLEEFANAPTYYFNNKYGDLEGYSIPFAAIKSSELENLALATADLLSTIPGKLSPAGDFNFDHLVYYDYDRRTSVEYGYDIYHSLKENTSESDFANWEPWFRKAVPYSRFSAKWLSSMNQLIADMQVFSESTQDYGMVSMFFPRQIYDNAGQYSSYRILNLNTAIQAFEWNSVIRWQQYGW